MIEDLNILSRFMGANTKSMRLQGFQSMAAWERHFEENRETYNCRWRFEQNLLALGTDDLWFGWCGLCEQPVKFELPSVTAGSTPNLREELVCRNCGTNARVRAGLQIAKANMDARMAQVYITEQASPTYVWMQKNFPRVIGSEYVQNDTARSVLQQYLADLGGEGQIRVEDVTKLEFPDASLDVIASFDVLEHVPDYSLALQEFARTLRSGGLLVLTAPFISDNQHTVVRARLSGDGDVEHLLPPEYHGDPLGEGGILCFYHFGWDLLDVARAAGFSEACMALPWIPGMGLMDRLWTLTAIR